MRSRKLQALDFIKRYFAEWGASPSLEEIGAALDVSRQRASELVEQLSIDQQIRRVNGKRRGISLIERADQISEAEAILALAREGWVVNAARLDDLSGRYVRSLTKSGLHGLPELDHDADGDQAAS